MREAVIERLCRDIGLPPGAEAAIPMLPAVLLAWSDGRVDDKEVVAIKERAEATGLPDTVLAAVYHLLEKHPGPYFQHRTLHLLNAMRDRVPAEEREKWAHELEDVAESVAQAGGIFARLFGLHPREKEDLSRLADALERAHPAEIDEWLDRLVTVSALRVAGLPALAAEGATVHKTVKCEMGHDGPIQALAVHVEVPGWEPLVVACIETFATGTELGAQEIAEILAHTAHRPMIERWIALRQAIATVSRPLGAEERKHLLDAVAKETKSHVHEATLPEMADLEDQLARGVGWMTWLAGKVPELRVDRTRVKRTLAPGTADIARKGMKVELVRTEKRPVEGIAFPVLEIRGADGQSLRLATPEIASGPPSPAACTWIGRFLPVMRDPRSVVLLDDGEDRPHWTIEMHSAMLDEEPAKPVREPLPPGRALVTPPWTWIRVCWALGVDPEPPA